MRGRLTACNMCPYAASTLVSQVMSILTHHCQALYQHHRKQTCFRPHILLKSLW